MKDSCYLIFTKKGVRRIAKGRRATWGPRERPALEAGEYAVFVTVIVPDAVFAPRTTPEATITVPEVAVIEPRVAVDVQTPPADDVGATEGRVDEMP